MTEPTGQTPRPCPYCHTPCDEATRCPACNAAHHPDCWSELGGCAVAGCDSRPPTTQAPEQPATQTSTASPRPPSDTGHTNQSPPAQAHAAARQPGQTGASPSWGAAPGQRRPGDWGPASSRQPPLTADGHPIPPGVDLGEFVRKPWVWGTGLAVLLLVLMISAGGNTTDSEPNRIGTGTSDIERQIEQGLEANWGFSHTVDCPTPSDLNKGTSFRCFASSSEGPSTIYVQIRDDDGGFSWREDV